MAVDVWTRTSSEHLQRMRWIGGVRSFRTGQRQPWSRCLFALERLQHCLPPLETNTNCPLAPGLEMCSWGHVAKNSAACSHEWRAHSNVALVFSTKAWHGKKRSSSGHSHKCQGVVQSATNTGWVNRRQHLKLWPCLDQPSEPSSFIWTLCSKMSHGKSRARVMASCVFVGGPTVYVHDCPMETLPPWSNVLPYLSQVTALALWHKSSIWFHLTGAMNNLIRGIIISS